MLQRVLLHVVQVRSGRPSFRVLAAGVKRFEGAAFVESNLCKDEECESWLSAIFICRPGSSYQAAAMPCDRASLRESAASTGEG